MLLLEFLTHKQVWAETLSSEEDSAKVDIMIFIFAKNVFI